jgi:hypothetical protein
MSQHPIERFCMLCGQSASQTCTSCSMVHYCSTRCQRQHAEVHRRECISIAVHSVCRPVDMVTLRSLRPRWMHLLAQLVEGTYPGLDIRTQSNLSALALISAKALANSPVCGTFSLKCVSGAAPPSDQELVQMFTASLNAYYINPDRNTHVLPDGRFQMSCSVRILSAVLQEFPIDWDEAAQQKFAACKYRFLLSVSWHGIPDMYWLRMTMD